MEIESVNASANEYRATFVAGIPSYFSLKHIGAKAYGAYT